VKNKMDELEKLLVFKKKVLFKKGKVLQLK